MAQMGESRGMESPTAFTEPGDDQDDNPVPCKACGEILEEGKAYELAGNRWHIECFRCHACGTFLDSDANLLMLGDGSLICNNCTYSCTSCGNKIEDLAILTGDQAFCATCFKCRNCKREIDNLRYARTSQGIFCMDCHESLMARRRKRSARNAAQRQKTDPARLDKSLPSLPPSLEASSRQETETPSTDPYSETPPRSRAEDDHANSRNGLPNESQNTTQDTLILPSSTYSSQRHSVASHKSDNGEEFLIPVAFDPTPTEHQSPQIGTDESKHADHRPRDYFSRTISSDSRPSLSPGDAHTGHHERPPQREHALRQTDSAVNSPSADVQESVSRQSASRRDVLQDSDRDKFKLQDIPKSKGDTPPVELESEPVSRPRGDSAMSPKDQTKPGHPEHQKSGVSPASPPHPTESIQDDYGDAAASVPLSQMHYPPRRGDSLETKRPQQVRRKEVPTTSKSSHSQGESKSDATISTPPESERNRANSKAAELPGWIPFEGPGPSSSSHTRVHSDKVSSKEDNSTPTRAAFQSSTGSRLNHGQNDPAHPSQAELADPNQAAADLPRYSGAGDLSLDEDMARILASYEDKEDHDSFMRRVSNSVRHGRSFSDKGQRSSKDSKGPKSPTTSGANATVDVSSPTTMSSPENREDIAWFKSELKREREKVMEKERKISELESALNAAANIKQVNTELREKRSTMVFLDTQKEIVLRELEVMGEHIAAEKQSGAPLDVQNVSNGVLRDLAESLRGLKDSLSSQIEESIQKRNEILEELTNLGKMKDKSFQEFEQLSSKNAQLAELNNQLVHQIQGLYKANSNTPEGGRQAPNGLGIYSHHKDKSSTASVDTREIRPSPNEPPAQPSVSGQHEEAKSAAIVQGPQVVSIQKAQPRKFNWKGGGRHVAKGVTKGLKGAFSSQRDGQLTETGPYGSNQPADDHSRQGFGFFGNQRSKPQALKAQQSNGGSPAMSESQPGGLFGVDLEPRLGIEKGVIPCIVTRCIEEVELRGMEDEGIYRKSGASSQIQTIREGFERSSEYDISDPDLDIHAVTSALKLYFRKLPTPLITYDVYDKLLDSCGVNPISTRIEMMQRGIQDLPRVHRDVLEFLVFHLKRVVEREKENLMTSMNISVVFAPTILRPESLSREMTDVSKKNEAMQFLVENCQDIFMGIQE